MNQQAATQYMHGIQHSRIIKLWIAGANPDEPPVLSCAGVCQGDPLGPLLFALVLQPALEHLATHHADAPCAAYADDIGL